MSIEAACAIIAKGETRAIDIGKINDQVFIEVAGIGLEAALFPAAEEIKSPGFFTTVRGVINGLLSYSPSNLQSSESLLMIINVAHMKRYRSPSAMHLTMERIFKSRPIL